MKETEGESERARERESEHVSDRDRDSMCQTVSVAGVRATECRALKEW